MRPDFLISGHDLSFMIFRKPHFIIFRKNNFGDLEKIFSGELFFLDFFSIKELDRIFHFRYFRASTDLWGIIYSTFTFVILSKSTCTTPTLTLRFATVHLAVASKKTMTIYEDGDLRTCLRGGGHWIVSGAVSLSDTPWSSSWCRWKAER